MSKTACPSVYNLCWRQYNLYRVLDAGPTCDMWVVGGGDTHTGWTKKKGVLKKRKSAMVVFFLKNQLEKLEAAKAA